MSKRKGMTSMPAVGSARAMLALTVVLLALSPLFMGSTNAAEEEDSEHEYHNNELTFLIVSFVMSYGAMAILTSLFTFKFGQKRSKLVAIPVLTSGLIIWGIWIFFKFIQRAAYPDDTIIGIIHWSAAPILKPILAVLGMALGAGIAVFIFLTVVVRS